MPEMEEQLLSLSHALEWPPTPDLGQRVSAVLARQPRFNWERLAAIAAGVLLLAAALLAYTPARDAIANFLNLHTTINRVPVLETPSPPAGQRLGLGQPTTLSQAQGSLSWNIALPGALGRPDEVYLAIGEGAPSGGEVTLVYMDEPGIAPSGQTGVSVLVTEARGAVDEQFFGKTVGPGNTIENVTVNGHSGWWIAGTPHVIVITDRNGNPYTETLRLATNTLILDDSGTIVRIEGQMKKDKALRIAASI